MNPKLQRRIQRYGWDKAVTYYEQYWAKQLEPAQDRMLEMANLQPCERVLDIACGTGLVTFRAAQIVGPNGHVLGTDISEQMVVAARNISRQQQINHAKFERMEAENLQIPNASFDAALCAVGLMYFADPVEALLQMNRALKSGGRAVAAVWGQRNRCGWAEVFPIVDSRVKTEVCPLFFQLGTQDVLMKTFMEAGFAFVKLERLSTTLCYETPEDACGAAFAGGPVALAYSRFDEQTREEAHSEYLTSIERYRNGNVYEIPGEFVVAVGHKLQ